MSIPRILDGQRRVPGQQELDVEGVAAPVAHRPARRHQRLCQQLAAEQARACPLDARALEAVAVERDEVQ